MWENKIHKYFIKTHFYYISFNLLKARNVNFIRGGVEWEPWSNRFLIYKKNVYINLLLIYYEFIFLRRRMYSNFCNSNSFREEAIRSLFIMLGFIHFGS